jgi:hypothetical protein
MMEMTCYRETLLPFYRTTRHHTQENCNLHTHRCEKFDSEADTQFVTPHFDISEFLKIITACEEHCLPGCNAV